MCPKTATIPNYREVVHENPFGVVDIPAKPHRDLGIVLMSNEE